MLFKGRVCRLERRCTPRTLKEWLSCRIYHHPTLSAEEIAERAMIVFRFLRRYADAGQPHQIPASRLVNLCQVVGDFSAFDFLLEPYGYRITRIDDSMPRVSMTEAALDLAVAAGRVVEALQRSRQFGVMDDDQAAVARAHISELRRQTDNLSRQLARVVPGAVESGKEPHDCSHLRKEINRPVLCR